MLGRDLPTPAENTAKIKRRRRPNRRIASLYSILFAYIAVPFPTYSTLQINEPQLQRSKHQCATHQRLSTSTVSG